MAGWLGGWLAGWVWQLLAGLSLAGWQLAAHRQVCGGAACLHDGWITTHIRRVCSASHAAAPLTCAPRLPASCLQCCRAACTRGRAWRSTRPTPWRRCSATSSMRAPSGRASRSRCARESRAAHSVHGWLGGCLARSTGQRHNPALLSAPSNLTSRCSNAAA